MQYIPGAVLDHACLPTLVMMVNMDVCMMKIVKERWILSNFQFNNFLVKTGVCVRSIDPDDPFNGRCIDTIRKQFHEHLVPVANLNSFTRVSAYQTGLVDCAYYCQSAGSQYNSFDFQSSGTCR